MTSMQPYFQRLVLALTLTAAVAVPSTLGESRPSEATDLRRMAAELEAAVARAHGRDADVRDTSPVPMREIVDAMNEHRRRAGLRDLTLDDSLVLAARDRLDDMFRQRYFAHESPSGRSPFVAVRNRGYRFDAIAENLAWGQRTAREVVDSWMRSPGHRKNILDPRYRDCGLAIANGSPVAASQGFTFVAFFGHEAPTPVRAGMVP
jgi:uncharacterized protein YkwD